MRRVPLFVVVVLIGLMLPPVAAAQEDDGPLVRVLAMSPWVDADHPMRIRLRIENGSDAPLDGVVVRVSVHNRVSTRSDLRAALDFGPTGPVVRSFEEPVGRIGPGARTTVRIVRRAGQLPSDRGPYPLTITIAHDGGQRTLVTALPIFPPSPVGPVNVALALRVDRPAIADPAMIQPQALAELNLEALTEQMTALTEVDTAPVTLAPSPAFVDVLLKLADAGVDAAGDSLSAMRRAAAVVGELATVPYAAVDLPALAGQGPRGDVLSQVTTGRATIEQVLGRAPTLAAFVPPRLSLDDDSLLALGDLGIGGVLVGPAVLARAPSEPADLAPEKFGPLFPFPLGGIAMPALLADEGIRARIDTSTQGVLLAQAVIAETLGVWQELPLFSPQRVVLIAPERIPNPSALVHAVDGLVAAPWVDLQPVSGSFASAAAVGPAVPFAPRAERSRAYLLAAREGRRALSVLSAIALEGVEDLPALERMLLLAESDDWLDDPQHGVTLARRVISRVDEVLDGLRVAPRRVTLTSRTGDAPLTIVNRNPFRVRVRVRLFGPKVGFPAGATRELELAPGDNTISIPVEARATGSFPVEVALETPDGRRVLADGRIVLRSTAVSAVSLGIVAGSVVFLLLAWVRRAARRERSAPTPRSTVWARGR